MKSIKLTFPKPNSSEVCVTRYGHSVHPLHVSATHNDDSDNGDDYNDDDDDSGWDNDNCKIDDTNENDVQDPCVEMHLKYKIKGTHNHVSLFWNVSQSVSYGSIVCNSAVRSQNPAFNIIA